MMITIMKIALISRFLIKTPFPSVGVVITNNITNIHYRHWMFTAFFAYPESRLNFVRNFRSQEVVFLGDFQGCVLQIEDG